MIEKYGALRSERDVARLLGVSVRTLQRWRLDGGGPAFIRLGSRRIGYSDTEIERWAASRSFASLAAELAARQPAA
jgi:predicted DNA-binding transcriptional regulator AlpA